MPNSYTEGLHNWAPLISEAPGTRSRSNAVILAGSGAVRALTAGMIVGKRLIGATATSTAFAGNTGNGVMGAITVTGPAKRGRYRLSIHTTVTNAGNFNLFDPDGKLVESGAVAAAFSAGGIAFTLADGGTDFVAGDGFFIDVEGGTEKWQQLDTAGTNGEAIAAGVLMTDATAPDGADLIGQAAVIVADAEVNASEVTWPGGITTALKNKAIAELAQLGIVLR